MMGLNAEPAWRWACVARLKLLALKSRPPAGAGTSPDLGSIATSPRWRSFAARRLLAISVMRVVTVRSASRCSEGSYVEYTRSPPRSILSEPTSATRCRLIASWKYKPDGEPPPERALRRDERRVLRRRSHDRRKKRGLLGLQIDRGFPEVPARGRFNAVQPAAEVDRVQVLLEDLRLRVLLLDPRGKQHFAHLPPVRPDGGQLRRPR